MAQKVTVSRSLWKRAEEVAPVLNRLPMVRAACGGTVSPMDVLRIAMERGLELLVSEGLTGSNGLAKVHSSADGADAGGPGGPVGSGKSSKSESSTSGTADGN